MSQFRLFPTREGEEANPTIVPRESACAPERKRTRNEIINGFRHVRDHVYAHEHVYVVSQKVKPLVGVAAFPRVLRRLIVPHMKRF